MNYLQNVRLCRFAKAKFGAMDQTHSYRILHTSDWHLGNTLHERSRLDEFKFFLDWLREAIVSNAVDALLVSGDIFDTGSPSNSAQELYYSFLKSLNGTCCKRVIVTAGNHDSPATLNAARELLEAVNVTVVATPDAQNDFSNEIILLPTAEDPKVIVCAAPYLRDSALQASLGDSHLATDEEFVREGTRAHFRKLKELALKAKSDSGKDLPIIAMAHLFAAGSKPSENAEAEYSIVGNLENVHSDIFSGEFSYVALGHIHRAQKVGENRIRYSGSPLPMGFDEAVHENEVLLVDFEAGKSPNIQSVTVPRYRNWITISGESLEELREKIEAAGEKSPEDRKDWVRIRFTGAANVGNLRQTLASDFEKSKLELVHAEYAGRAAAGQSGAEDVKDLSELSPTEIFAKRLSEDQTLEQDPELKSKLEKAFQEILKEIQERSIEE